MQNFGAGDILEINGPGLNGVLVPFTKAAVPVVDRRHAHDPHRHASPPALPPTTDGDGEADDTPSPAGGFDPKRRPRGPRDAGGNR